MEELKDPWHNNDDYRFSHTGKWLTDAWDYPRNRTYKSLERLVANNKLPRVMVFSGPTGSRKTITAYQIACAVSCEKYDARTHVPCGDCATCKYILTGKGNWHRGSLFEINGASPDGSSDALKSIDEAFRWTMSYVKQEGDASYPSIVFIDEAHRMTEGHRDTLLKLSEKWCKGVIILATTRADLLTVKGSSDDGNPLLNRSEVFQFGYPTAQECVNGVDRAAKQENLCLAVGVAEWIVAFSARCPRTCLGVLYRLSNHGANLDAKAVIEEYGVDSWKRFLEQKTNAAKNLADNKDPYKPDLS